MRDQRHPQRQPRQQRLAMLAFDRYLPAPILIPVGIIAAAVAVVSTLLVVTRTNLVHALLYLVISLFAVAVIFFVFLWPLVQLTYVLERRLARDE